MQSGLNDCLNIQSILFVLYSLLIVLWNSFVIYSPTIVTASCCRWQHLMANRTCIRLSCQPFCMAYVKETSRSFTRHPCIECWQLFYLPLFLYFHQYLLVLSNEHNLVLGFLQLLYLLIPCLSIQASPLKEQHMTVELL